MAAFQTGCSYNPTPDYTPGKTVPAKSGTTYTFKNTPIDTTGKPMPDSSYMTVDSVAETGLQLYGKNNVTHIVSTNLKFGLSTDNYINFESNGDVSIYTSSGIGAILAVFGINIPPWVTYPVQSHTTVSLKLFEDTVTIPNIPLPLDVVGSDTNSFVNTGTATASGKTMGVFNLKSVTPISGSTSPFPGIKVPIFTTSQVRTISFAPSIGYYTDQLSNPMTNLPFGVPAIQGSDAVLVSYTLK